MGTARIKSIVVVLALLSLSWDTTVHAQTWTSIGPAPLTSGPYVGRCSSVAPSTTNASKYYVGSASGGVWRTLDGGLLWEPLTDHLPINAIGALAVDPIDDDIVYAGSGEANFANHSFYGEGVYKSIDGGDSWIVLGRDDFGGRTFSRLAIAPDDTQTIFGSVMHAGGFPARNAAKGHVGRDDPVGVYRSQDGGLTWTLLAGGLPATAASDVWTDPSTGNIVYAAIGDIYGPAENGIYKSIDGGDTWTKLAGGLPAGGNGRITLAVAPSDAQRLYAMITNPASAVGGGASTKGVYRSDDGGATWLLRSPGNIQASYGWFLSTMLVDPLDPDTVFAGGLTLVRSVDGGASWSTITPSHVDMHGLAYDASHRLLCANDGGLYRSTNNGSVWSSIHDSLAITQFYAGLSVSPASETFVLGGTQDNGTNIRNGPLDWSEILGGDGGYTALHPGVSTTMFFEYQGSGNLFYSNDGGSGVFFRGSGISTSDRHCFLPPVAFAASDPTTLLYATHRIYRSTNTGASWTAISGDLTGGGSAAVRAMVIAPSDGLIVYAATNDGRVSVSIDGGSNWDVKLTSIPGGPRVTRELAVDPVDAGRAYLAISQFGVDQVLRTTDFGDTWDAIGGNLPDTPGNTVAVYRVDDDRAVFVGTDNGVYVSSVNESLWTLYGSGMPHSPVVDIVVDVVHDRLVVSTMGRGMWVAALPDLETLGVPVVPAVSHWGVVALCLLVVIAGCLIQVKSRHGMANG